MSKYTSRTRTASRRARTRRMVAAAGIVVALVLLVSAFMVGSGMVLAAGADSPGQVFSVDRVVVIGNAGSSTLQSAVPAEAVAAR